MAEAKFEKQHYGATVATILETDNSVVEVQEHNDGEYGLIVHHRRDDRDNWDDLTAYLKPEHFDLLGSVARRMRGEQTLTVARSTEAISAMIARQDTALKMAKEALKGQMESTRLLAVSAGFSNTDITDMTACASAVLADIEKVLVETGR